MTDTNNDQIAVLFEAVRTLNEEIKSMVSAQKSSHQKKNLRKLTRKMDEVLLEAADTYPLPDQIVDVDEEELDSVDSPDLSEVDITPVGITEEISEEVVTRFVNRTNKNRQTLKAIRSRLGRNFHS